MQSHYAIILKFVFLALHQAGLYKIDPLSYNIRVVLMYTFTYSNHLEYEHPKLNFRFSVTLLGCTCTAYIRDVYFGYMWCSAPIVYCLGSHTT